MARLFHVVLAIALVALLALSATPASAQLMSSSDSLSSNVTCIVKNCDRCVSGLATQCNSCKTGYKKTASLLCEMQCRVVNCAACAAASNTQCLTCANGYKRNKSYLCVKVLSTSTTYSAAAAPASLWLAAGTAVAAVAAIVL